MAVSVAALTRGLEMVVRQEKEALKKLDAERLDLARSNERLQHEVEERGRVEAAPALERGNPAASDPAVASGHGHHR